MIRYLSHIYWKKKVLAKLTGEKWIYVCWSVPRPGNVWIHGFNPRYLLSFLSEITRLRENNLVWFCFPRQYNLMAYLSPGVGSVTAKTEHCTHSLHTVHPKIFAPTLRLTFGIIIIIIIWKCFCISKIHQTIKNITHSLSL